MLASPDNVRYHEPAINLRLTVPARPTDNAGLLCVSQEARRVMEEEEQRELARLENHLARERVSDCLGWFLGAYQ